MTRVSIAVGNDGPDEANDITVSFVGLEELTVTTPTLSQGSWQSPTWSVGRLPVGSSATIDMEVTNDGESEVTITALAGSENVDDNLGNNIYEQIIPVTPPPPPEPTFSLYPRLSFQEYSTVTLQLDSETSVPLTGTSSVYSRGAVHVESALAVWPDMTSDGFWIFDGRAGTLVQVNDGVYYYQQASFSPSGDKILIPHLDGSVAVPRIYNRSGQLLSTLDIQSNSGFVMGGENDLVYAKYQGDGIYWHDMFTGYEMRLFLFTDVTLNRFIHSNGIDVWFLNDVSGVYSLGKFDGNTEEFTMQALPGYVQNYSIHNGIIVITFQESATVGVYDLATCQVLKEIQFDPSVYSPHISIDSSGNVVVFWAENPPEGGAPAVNYEMYTAGNYDSPAESGLTGQDFNTYQGYGQPFLAPPVIRPDGY